MVTRWLPTSVLALVPMLNGNVFRSDRCAWFSFPTRNHSRSWKWKCYVSCDRRTSIDFDHTPNSRWVSPDWSTCKMPRGIGISSNAACVWSPWVSSDRSTGAIPLLLSLIDLEQAPVSSTASPMSTESPTASTQERLDDVQSTSTETEKGEKRAIDEPLEEEDIPVMQRLNKRVRYAEKENSAQLTGTSVPLAENIAVKPTPSDTQLLQGRESSAKRLKKKRTPSSRSKKQSIAGWATKYQIEDCCVLLDSCDRMLEVERD